MYFAFFSLPVTLVRFAAIMAGSNPRCKMLDRLSAPPAPLGKTRQSSPFGQASFHSRRIVISIGGIGTVRSPTSDFGRPMALNRSARSLAAHRYSRLLGGA